MYLFLKALGYFLLPSSSLPEQEFITPHGFLTGEVGEKSKKFIAGLPVSTMQPGSVPLLSNPTLTGSMFHISWKHLLKENMLPSPPAPAPGCMWTPGCPRLHRQLAGNGVETAPAQGLWTTYKWQSHALLSFWKQNEGKAWKQKLKIKKNCLSMEKRKSNIWTSQAPTSVRLKLPYSPPEIIIKEHLRQILSINGLTAQAPNCALSPFICNSQSKINSLMAFHI